MRIDKHLAEIIARAAIAASYRQIDVQNTQDFSSWLRDRDIVPRWETIHHLWSTGILHPVAVLEPALETAVPDHRRFVPIDLGYRAQHSWI